MSGSWDQQAEQRDVVMIVTVWTVASEVSVQHAEADLVIGAAHHRDRGGPVGDTRRLATRRSGTLGR